MKTIFIVCQHGDEKTPFKVINKYFEGKIDYLLANLDSYVANKRYIECDLNRSFPGKINGLKEERIAYEMRSTLKKYDQIIDLHTTSATTPIFIITTRLTKSHQSLIGQLSVKRVVYMQNSIAIGNSLIDHVPNGVSIEVGREGDPETENIYKRLIKSFLSNAKKSKKEYYFVFDILKKKDENEVLLKEIQSFKFVKKGSLISKKRMASCNFYPILAREKSYKDILTLMARKLSKYEINAILYDNIRV